MGIVCTLLDMICYHNITSVMQGIFGTSLISRCVVQGVLFALHACSGCTLTVVYSLQCRMYTTRECYNIKRRYDVGVWLERT